MGSRLTDGLASLRRDYAAQLDSTMMLMAREWMLWRSGDRDAGVRLRREVHRLYGSGAVFGYRDISKVAERVENLIDRALDGGDLDPASLDDALAHLAEAARPIERSGGRKPRARSPRPRSADRDVLPGSRE